MAEGTTTPLLPTEPLPKLAKGAWKQELKTLMALAAPCIVTTCSAQTMVMTDQVFVGHLGVKYLAAAALGNTYFNLMWFFLLGCSTALDTLGSQAYGANDYSALLTWTFAALIVLSGFCGIMGVGLWYAREVALYLFFQPMDVADAISVFCRYLIPGLWPMMWSVVIMKFMQTQNCMTPPAYVSVFATLLNVFNNWIFIHYFGFVGAPIATSLSRLIQFFVYVVVVAYIQNKAHPTGWSRWFRTAGKCMKKAFSLKVLGLFSKLGIPGGLMLALEVGSFEITTTFAGALGTVQVAAHAAMLGVCTYTFISFPFAVATAATIRVGNLLGANSPAQAKLASTLAIWSGGLFQASCGLIMLAFKDKIALLFTNDPAVVATTASIAIFGVAFQFCDGAFGTAQGVLRGMGKQTLLLVYNIIGFWGLGVALGWYLTFRTPLKLKGLWLGIDSGDFISAVMCVTTVILVNWPKEAQDAQDKMKSAHDHDNDLEAVGHIEGEPDTPADFLVPHPSSLVAAEEAFDPHHNPSVASAGFGSPKYAGHGFRGA